MVDVPMTMGLTGLIVTTGIIALGIYDLIMAYFKGTGWSVSDFLIRIGWKKPMVVGAFMFCAGHLFGYMYQETCPGLDASILAPNFWMKFWFLTVAAFAVYIFREKINE